MVTHKPKDSGREGLSLSQKAELLRAQDNRGAISAIARELGKSHTLVSRLLSGEYEDDAEKAWYQTVLSAIDRKVSEIQRIRASETERKPKPPRRPL
jgi:hypothetical protein